MECSQLRLGKIVKMVHTQWQDKHLADLAIATDLNFLVVIPWIYQMMSLLEWNISSVEEKNCKKEKKMFTTIRYTQ